MSYTEVVKYKHNSKEYDESLGINTYDFGARNYDPALGRWMNIDPLAEQYRRWSPYTYAINNPMRFVDPDGMSVDDWVKKGNTWSWNSNITSKSQAIKAGYDDYSAPGKIITTTSGSKVRLGENGAIHTGIIGIHSNVSENAGFTDGHAWISTSSVDGQLTSTLGLWPDAHPLFQGQDANGNISDVRTDTELNAGYADAAGNTSFYAFATADEMQALTDFANSYDEWGYTHTCADWASDAFKASTGVRVDSDDYLGAETPREITQSINEMGANTPQNPKIKDENKSSSSFN